jgi:hypothetical protein
LPEIAKHHPRTAAYCIALAERMLDLEAGQVDIVAGFANSALIDLKAADPIASIRDAFGRNAVDISVAAGKARHAGAALPCL